MSTSVFRLAAIVLALLVLVPRLGRAQASALQWELVGNGIRDEYEDDVYEGRIDGIAFRRGAAPSGSLDTLYALGTHGLFRFSPGAEEWEEICKRCGANYMTATKEGYLLIGSEAGPHADGARSTDGGRTWERDVIGVSMTVLFQSTLPALGGAVYACNGAYCARSFDGGARGSWSRAEPMGGSPAALGEVVASAALPDGRLLGGAWNGAVYSDDGGQTWAPSSLWQAGRFVVNSLTFAPVPEHPFGGVAYAGVRDFGLGRPALYRSDDAGQTWTLVLEVNPGDYGVAGPDWIVVQASPELGGEIYAGVEDTIAGPAPSVGTVLTSTDGEATWTQAADSTNGWGGWAPRVFEVGRDGRLYAGTDRGVYRTVEPVFPVSAEREPDVPRATGMELGVSPNPMADEATLALRLAEPERARIALYDVLGREVLRLHEGRLAMGEHLFSLDTSALPSGLYLVRVEGVGQALTQPLTVSR